MADVLGAVAAATQLGALCCSLLRLLGSIKTATMTLQNYQVQLQDLSLLSTSISQNPLLQTIEIQHLTQSLISLITNANLNSVLQRNRVLRVLHLFYREQDLLDTLSAVERQKLSLCLTIEQIQSTALFEIKSDLQIIASEKNNTGNQRSTLQIMRKATKTSKNKRPFRHEAVDDKQDTAAGAVKMPNTAANNQLIRLPKVKKKSTSDEPRILKNSPAAIEAGPSSGQNDASREGRDSAPRPRPLGRQVTSFASLSNIRAKGPVHLGFCYEGEAQHLAHFDNDMMFSNVRLTGGGNQTVGFNGNLSGNLDPNRDTQFHLATLAGRFDKVRIDKPGGKAAGPKRSIGVSINWLGTGSAEHGLKVSRRGKKSKEKKSKEKKREGKKSEEKKSEEKKSEEKKSEEKKSEEKKSEEKRSEEKKSEDKKSEEKKSEEKKTKEKKRKEKKRER